MSTSQLSYRQVANGGGARQQQGPGGPGGANNAGPKPSSSSRSSSTGKGGQQQQQQQDAQPLKTFGFSVANERLLFASSVLIGYKVEVQVKRWRGCPWEKSGVLASPARWRGRSRGRSGDQGGARQRATPGLRDLGEGVGGKQEGGAEMGRVWSGVVGCRSCEAAARLLLGCPGFGLRADRGREVMERQGGGGWGSLE